MLTPNDIEILIHYHCSPSPHPRLHAPAVSESVKRFVADGILDDNYRTTPKGAAFIALICATPYPQEAWINPLTGEVIP